jgi:hypothetical protein
MGGNTPYLLGNFLEPVITEGAIAFNELQSSPFARLDLTAFGLRFSCGHARSPFL